MIFTGLLELSWWGYVLAALGLTHVTIAAVTIYLHRCQAHRALELHPVISHFFRFWLWLTTGMVTKEWAAIHRKHHAKCETEDDPHSPQVYGINRVLWGGVFLYVKESHNPETLERYGHGTPEDWMERKLYTPFSYAGVFVLLALYLLVFGVVPGLLIWLVQIAWIPFWAAGVINGVGHFFGYRNYDVADASRNIVPWGVLIGGEELHNNHHAYPSSARFSNRWFEFDIGWAYLRIFQFLGLAHIKKVAPKIKLDSAKTACDLATVQAVITHRYEVLAKYAHTVRQTCADEIHHLKARAVVSVDWTAVKRMLHFGAESLPASEREKMSEALSKSKVLDTVYTMRQDLAALWQRSSASKDELVRQLEDWCARAEASGIIPLQEFSRRLRCYA
ncbi:MAG TPA: fatty acid desaturase [Burkholderiales bacterium]|nr:fatty acid desaturase [Burkholderiales bacterium]